MNNNPVLARVWRGNLVESQHRGAVAVVHVDGRRAFELGDTAHCYYPRSSLKFIQALPLVESGAADHLSDAQLALSCASHNGEPLHCDMVQQWLSELSLDENALACGPSLPLHLPTQHQHLRNGDDAQCHVHNCSGKHCGMLTLAQHWGVSIEGYGAYEHPTQAAWRQRLGELAQLDADALPWHYDGCTLPVVALPLYNMALAMAQFCTPTPAMTRIRTALAAHPQCLAGTGRLCTDLIRHSDARVFSKVGAEAYTAGFIPELGLGFALKIDDGNFRACDVAVAGVLRALGLTELSEHEALQAYFAPTIRDSRERAVGHIDLGEIWPPAPGRGSR